MAWRVVDGIHESPPGTSIGRRAEIVKNPKRRRLPKVAQNRLTCSNGYHNLRFSAIHCRYLTASKASGEAVLRYPALAFGANFSNDCGALGENDAASLHNRSYRRVSLKPNIPRGHAMGGGRVQCRPIVCGLQDSSGYPGRLCVTGMGNRFAAPL
jgi:hypothetical protein